MKTKEALDYSWQWFEYHASQRLTMFRFYLVFFGILVVGYSKAVNAGDFLFARIDSGFGAFISVVFLVLEIRNEQLVNLGRTALRQLEETDELLKMEPKLQLLHCDRTRSFLMSHKLWFRAIYLLCIILFLAGAFSTTLFAQPV